MSLSDLFWSHSYEIIALVVTCLVTGGISFLFYPAYKVYHHEQIQHTTSTLSPQQSKKNVTIDKEPDVLLSLVIPAYNEEDRLTVMLDECYEYFSQDRCQGLENLQKACIQFSDNKTRVAPHTVEWIVVNDGSTDQTCQIFESYAAKKTTPVNNKHKQPSSFLFKLVTLPVNEGKGAAVQAGMTEATGQYRLMVDADGATTFGAGLEAVTKELLQNCSNQTPQTPPVIIFGSRSGDGAQRSALRSFLMHSFLWLRSVVVGTPVSLRDTQCGFKLFDKSSAIQLFSNLHLRRWAFDIELVYVALSSGFTIKEVIVPWHEVDGSKLNTGFTALVLVAISMLRDMMCVRACYVLGIWRINQQVPQ